MNAPQVKPTYIRQKHSFIKHQRGTLKRLSANTKSNQPNPRKNNMIISGVTA